MSKFLNKSCNIKENQNKILQQYLSISTNYVICIDITKIGIYGEVFIAVDLASRNIIGDCYTSETITTALICETIHNFVQKRSFLPQINIIHSNQRSVFSNQRYINFIQNLGVTVSRGSAKANQNQVVELT